MSLIIISDLHLMQDDPRSDFHADVALWRFLYKHRANTIVIAGDVVDLWQGANVAAIERQRPALCTYIEDFVDYIVCGNHDGDLTEFCGHEIVEGPLIVKHRGWRIAVMHGHEFDPFNSGFWQWTGRAATQFAGFCERRIHRDADLTLLKMGRWLTGKGRYGDSAAYRNKALDYLEGLDADAIVLGHTHKYVEFNGLYGNCGHWLGYDPNKFTYVRID